MEIWKTGSSECRERIIVRPQLILNENGQIIWDLRLSYRYGVPMSRTLNEE
jgi:hypothetical protein